MSELTVLQAVRFKGRISPADLSATLGEDPADVVATVQQLTQAGLLIDGKTVRISPDGRTRLTELLAEDRAAVDAGAMAAVYDDFRGVNAEFKSLVTDWQVKDGQPNTHEDAAYDAGVLARVDEVHRRVVPIIATAALQLPRLSHYSSKLQAAIDKIHAGQTEWLSRPLIDSYHTVWFELHEELILAAGRTRESVEDQ
ncbi:MarR family transcriptional regulator [Mycobacterium branderi]|uniref:MarR family transcriptional regulator n=1 Tax=Mycobacterium branderi TaxID=43348 RepID=A0A7I7W4T0_9MYCO|nr:MarR family transcriptional regulator [Mycobacterium branderi]MCV7235902.1 MarR family transcriptional regulator [Mycobacterium branderi]ORA34743.1 MarR family transcriptional regulator [Mycobacterium branderi]BBZ12574.1 hypothetical protein MBRA_27690 [Mycobacterium branderi]